MYVDLNIKWPTTSDPQNQATKVLQFAQLLGYDVVAFNVEAKSVKAAKQVLATSFSETVLLNLQKRFPQMKILRRVTIVLDETSVHPNVAQLSAEPQSCDVIAVLPRTEKQLQSCATSLDIDLICIDTNGRLPFPLRHKLVGAAIKRGVKFEVCYQADRPSQLRHVISNAAMLVRATRNRGVVVSSGATQETGLRAPLDIANLLTLWGFLSGSARESVSKNAAEAATQGILRTRSVKQAVVVVSEEPPKKRLKTQ